MELYIDASVNFEDSFYKIALSPSSKCSLMLCKFPNKLENVKVYVVIKDNEYSLLNLDDLLHYEKNLRNLEYNCKILKFSEIPIDYNLVDLPVCISTGSLLIYSGPAAVFRNLVQSYYKDGDKISVFGTAQSCLKACKEKSKWTLMCEKTVIDLLSSFENKHQSFNESVLEDLNSSFKIHKGILNMINPKFSPKEFHPYLEGPRKTLSDIIIAFYLLEFSLNNDDFAEIFLRYPILNKWLCNMKQDQLEEISLSLHFLPISWELKESRLPENYSHTFSITDGLEKMTIVAKNNSELIGILSDNSVLALKVDFFHINNLEFCWDNIPMSLRPVDSQIPQSRQHKKSDQLINMVKCAEGLIKPGMTIVDFCSGGGHLGILMAALYPDCTVILLENKEESLSMAEKRIVQSGLNNIKLYKCNIFSYKGNFDVGMALHACGSVTDLVIEICLSRNAQMIISPCCYGSIAPSPNLQYPRSKKFTSVTTNSVYSKLCHAADCFNAKPSRIELGKEAMRCIDADRYYYVLEKKYQARIYKMVPEECTPKNHILCFIKIL